VERLPEHIRIAIKELMLIGAHVLIHDHPLFPVIEFMGDEGWQFFRYHDGSWGVFRGYAYAPCAEEDILFCVERCREALVG
jgi:hypothetical protein